jgi:hypothetical protein
VDSIFLRFNFIFTIMFKFIKKLFTKDSGDTTGAVSSPATWLSVPVLGPACAITQATVSVIAEVMDWAISPAPWYIRWTKIGVGILGAAVGAVAALTTSAVATVLSPAIQIVGGIYCRCTAPSWEKLPESRQLQKTEQQIEEHQDYVKNKSNGGGSYKEGFLTAQPAPDAKRDDIANGLTRKAAPLMMMRNSINADKTRAMCAIASGILTLVSPLPGSSLVPTALALGATGREISQNDKLEDNAKKAHSNDMEMSDLGKARKSASWTNFSGSFLSLFGRGCSSTSIITNTKTTASNTSNSYARSLNTFGIVGSRHNTVTTVDTEMSNIRTQGAAAAAA